jgi:hypothetical protein
MKTIGPQLYWKKFKSLSQSLTFYLTADKTDLMTIVILARIQGRDRI